MKIRVIERIVLLRIECNVDYGAERFLLAQRGSKRLTWRKAYTDYKNSKESHANVPGALCLSDPAINDGNSLVLYSDKGRISIPILLRFHKEIDSFFGCGISSELNINRTVMVEEV